MLEFLKNILASWPRRRLGRFAVWCDASGPYLEDVEAWVDHGAPANGILQANEEYEPDLLVMGTPGNGTGTAGCLG